MMNVSLQHTDFVNTYPIATKIITIVWTVHNVDNYFKKLDKNKQLTKLSVTSVIVLYYAENSLAALKNPETLFQSL